MNRATRKLTFGFVLTTLAASAVVVGTQSADAAGMRRQAASAASSAAQGTRVAASKASPATRAAAASGSGASATTATSSTPAPNTHTGGLGVASYNLFKSGGKGRAQFPGGGGDSCPSLAVQHKALDLIAKDLAATKADVILLQEIDNGSARTCHMTKQEQYLAKALGWDPNNTCFRQATATGGGGMGNAVLSRHPLRACWQRDFSTVPDQGEKRIMTAATVDVQGVGVAVASTHLSVDGGKDRRQARRTQANEIRRFLEQANGPAIVGGDFNARAGARELSSLAGLTDALPWLGISTATHSEGQIDHIIVRGLKPTSGKVYASSSTSDHHPLAVKFD